MTKPLLAFALVLLTATPALAAEPVAIDKRDGEPAKEHKVCRSEQVTGSIIATRTCHTKAEWAAIDQQNERDAANTLDRRNRGRRGTLN